MSDFYLVIANGFWVLGVALVLAALSWANWIAARERIPFRRALGRPGVRRAIDSGLVLFCAGLAATGRTVWEQVLWGALAVGLVVLAIWEEREFRRKQRGIYPNQRIGSIERAENANAKRMGSEE